jgi:hypothetical protein
LIKLGLEFLPLQFIARKREFSMASRWSGAVRRIILGLAALAFLVIASPVQAADCAAEAADVQNLQTNITTAGINVRINAAAAQQWERQYESVLLAYKITWGSYPATDEEANDLQQKLSEIGLELGEALRNLQHAAQQGLTATILLTILQGELATAQTDYDECMKRSKVCDRQTGHVSPGETNRLTMTVSSHYPCTVSITSKAGPVSVAIVANASRGTVTVDGNTVTYISDEGYQGGDGFSVSETVENQASSITLYVVTVVP